jgi:hypothetical protein
LQHGFYTVFRFTYNPLNVKDLQKHSCTGVK